MKHFLLARELPIIFALALAGLMIAISRGLAVLAFWLAGAAVWTLALWLILFRGSKHDS